MEPYDEFEYWDYPSSTESGRPPILKRESLSAIIGNIKVIGGISDDDDTGTLTNKTIDGDDNTISNLAHGAEVDNPTTAHGATGAVVGTTNTQTLTNKTITNPVNTAQTLTDGSTIDWDCNSGQTATVTLAGNRTLNAATNQKAGGRYILIVKQDATGSRTLAFNSNYLFPGGTDPTLSTAANAVDIIEFVSDGTNMYGIANYSFS